MRHAQDCNKLSAASYPRARACKVSLDLGWHRTRCWLYGRPKPGTVGLLVTTWTVSLVPGTASLAAVMVRMAPPGASLAPGMVSLAPVTVRLAPPGMYGKPGTGDGKPGTGDDEPEPGTCDQGAPGTADGRARDGTVKSG